VNKITAMCEYMADKLKHLRDIQPKPWVFTLLVFVFLSACNTTPPIIVVDPSSQDLGEMPQKPLEITYTVRNEGGSPLTIEKISTSCGCTYAEIERDTLAPGETTPLRVTLDPIEDNLYGNLTRVIYLRSNDPETPEAEVEFRVTILKPDGSAP
jgi:hypothetical protein